MNFPRIVKVSASIASSVLKRRQDQQKSEEKKQELPKLVPYRKWKDFFTFPGEGALKYLLLKRKENGFSKCVRIINNRIYLDVEATHRYFNDQKED